VEVVDRYSPDLIYFDSWLNYIPDSMRLKFCTYYLNHALEAGKEVVIVRKQHDLPLDSSVDDLEKSRKNHLAEKAWMTDETISNGSWCYTENLKIKPTVEHLHVLIDIVSKNGVMMLNISPRADGTIPDDQRKVLLELGEWLGSYGEAIYGTRPWYTYGEGPTGEPEHENPGDFQNITYTSEDVRYTTSDTSIYAILLGKPAPGKTFLFRAFSVQNSGFTFNIKKISIPGTNGELEWSMTEAGLSVQLPLIGLNEMATVLKIDTAG